MTHVHFETAFGMTGEDGFLAWIGVWWVSRYSGQSQPRLSNYEVIRQVRKTF